jgi:hypothetical protein
MFDKLMQIMTQRAMQTPGGMEKMPKVTEGMPPFGLNMDPNAKGPGTGMPFESGGDLGQLPRQEWEMARGLPQGGQPLPVSSGMPQGVPFQGGMPPGAAIGNMMGGMQKTPTYDGGFGVTPKQPKDSGSFAGQPKIGMKPNRVG